MTEAVASSGLLPLVERGLYLTLPRRGIVHVGANDGAEIQWYLDRGMTPILCFEPNPQAFKRAMDRWDGEDEIGFVRLALGAEQGLIDMHIPADGDDEKTSRYRAIPTPGHDWTAIQPATSITVPVERFDSWLSHTDIDLLEYGTLVVDVQGMELEVLRGFGDYLRFFKYLCVELSERPIYDGEPPAADVIDYLVSMGFARESEIVEHGDVLFSNER